MENKCINCNNNKSENNLLYCRDCEHIQELNELQEQKIILKKQIETFFEQIFNIDKKQNLILKELLSEND